MERPVTDTQQRQLEGFRQTGRSNLNVAVCWRFQGPLDEGALHRSVHNLVQDYALLRTRVTSRDGRLYRAIHPHGPAISSHRGPYDVGTIAALCDQPFDIADGRLLRLHFLRDRDVAVLVLVVHHAVADATSADILYRDLAERYRREVGLDTPRPAATPQAPFTQTRAARDGLGPERRSYWRRAIGPPDPRIATPLGIPGWRHDDKLLTCDPGATLPPRDFTELRSVARQQRVPLIGVVLAAVAAASPARGGDHVVCTVLRANRDHDDTVASVGPVADFLPVRVQWSPTSSFMAVARDAAKAWQANVAHAAPLDAINDVLAGPCEWPYGTPYHVSLNYLPASPGSPHLVAGPLSISKIAIPYPLRRIRLHRWPAGSFPFEFNLVEERDGRLVARGLRLGEVVRHDQSQRATLAFCHVLARISRNGGNEAWSSASALPTTPPA